MAKNTIVLSIAANAAQARAELKSTTASVEQAASRWKSAGSAFGSLGAGLGAAAGITAAIAGVRSATAAYEDAGKAAMALQRVMGGTTTEASRLAGEAKLAGLSTDDLSTYMAKLAKTAETNPKVLRQLGISLTDASGATKSMATLLPELADRFKSMPAGIERTALAQQLFGRSGTGFLGFLSRGSAGLAELGARSDAYGLTLTGNTDELKRQAQAQRDLAGAWQGAKIQLGEALVPVMATATQALMGLTKEATAHAAELRTGLAGVSAVVGSPVFGKATEVIIALKAAQIANATATKVWTAATTVAAKAQGVFTAATVEASAATKAQATLDRIAADAKLLSAEKAVAAARAEQVATEQAYAAAFANARLAPVQIANTTALTKAEAQLVIAREAATAATKAETDAMAVQTGAAVAQAGRFAKLTTALEGFGAANVALGGFAVGYGIGTLANKWWGLSDAIDHALDRVHSNDIGAASVAAAKQAAQLETFQKADLAKKAAQAKAAQAATPFAQPAAPFQTAWLQQQKAELLGVAKAWETAHRGQIEGLSDDQIIAKYNADLKASNALLEKRRQVTTALTKISSQYQATFAKDQTAIQDATQHLQDQVSAMNSLSQQIAQAVSGTTIADISLSRSVASLDGKTVQASTGLKAFQDGLKARLAAATQFAANVKALRAKGFSLSIVEQVAESGTEQGGQLASALKGATAAQVAQINSMQSQLVSAGQGLGQFVGHQVYDSSITQAQQALATAQAKAAADVKAWLAWLKRVWNSGYRDLSDSLFKSGQSVAQGLAEGLASQQSAVQKQADALADTILGINTKLDIHSPSRKAAATGRFWGLGLVQGLASQVSSVSASSAALADAVSGATMRIPVQRISPASVSAAGVAAAPVHITVNASPGTDKARLGKELAELITAHERATGIRRTL